MSTRDVDHYTQGLPRHERLQINGTYAEGLNANLQMRAVWALHNAAVEGFVRSERRRRELVGDDEMMAQVTAQFTLTACESANRVQQGMFGGIF